MTPTPPQAPAAPACGPIDRVTRIFQTTVLLAGLIYVCFGWTPSSYGIVLNQLRAPDSGPVLGEARDIRSDEWAVFTPMVQAAVRNRFQRINRTSFYRENLRSYFALPLRDWSLAFEPQFWAFFALPPASAYSIYWAMTMCAFLAGYQLLFHRLGFSGAVAAAAALTFYCNGASQFWWTAVGPALAAFPWLPLVLLKPAPWWRKLLWCAWLFPVFAFSRTYPILLLTLLWAAFLLLMAVQPSLFRSGKDLAAIAMGALAAGAAVYLYYADLFPLVQSTIYPGHRVAPPGTVPLSVALSQIFPFLTFRLRDYGHLIGQNLCEIGAAGSFLPLFTLCTVRYGSLWTDRRLRNSMAILLAGFTAFTLWQIAPVPAWIGQILLWNIALPQRLFFASGFVLLMASLLPWRYGLISTHPARIGIFLVIGPIGSLVLKRVLFHVAASELLPDLLLGAFLCAAALFVYLFPQQKRAPILLGAITLLNVYAFGRFNPLQPAQPIFETRDTAVLDLLHHEADASPGHVLVESRFFGAILNGLGFRSVTHVLPTPKLAFFRTYFPSMDAERFNWTFNRFAHVRLKQVALPVVAAQDAIELPIDVFLPTRNVRRAEIATESLGACLPPDGSAIDHIKTNDSALIIEGWAPWLGETADQGIRIYAPSTVRIDSLQTVTRPDVAEGRQDYRFVKAGFRLQLSRADGRTLPPSDVALSAFGTTQGDMWLRCAPTSEAPSP